MAVTLAIDVGVDVQNRALFGLTLAPTLDGNGDAVGNLLTEQLEHLLTDDLGGDGLLGLVAGGVRREEMRALKGELGQFLHQRVQSVAIHSGDGHDSGKIRRLRPRIDAGQQCRLIGEGINLIDDQDNRHFLLL